MKSDNRRRSIRLQNYDYSSPGAYFVTVCTENKGNALGEIIGDEMQLNELGRIVEECWIDLPNRIPNIKLDEFAIMPNHVHFILIITPPNAAERGVGAHTVGAIHELPLRCVVDKSVEHRIDRRRMLLPKTVGRFKMVSSKRINQIRKLPGVKFWQRNYYEHVIRTEADLNAIRQYIRNNPANWERDEYYT